MSEEKDPIKKLRATAKEYVPKVKAAAAPVVSKPEDKPASSSVSFTLNKLAILPADRYYRHQAAQYYR